MNRVGLSAAVGVVVSMISGCGTSSSVLKAEVLEALREDGSKAQAFVVSPRDVSEAPVVFYLNGSSCHSVTSAIATFNALASCGYIVVAPEKRGIEPGDESGNCSKEFLDTNDRETRSTDVARLFAKARATLLRADGRVVLVGRGEGGLLLPALGREQGVVGVMLVDVGGLTVGEELLEVHRREMAAAHPAPTAAELADETRAFEAQIEAVRADPTSTSRTFLGSDRTFRYWASYLDDSALPELLDLKVPIFLGIDEATRETPPSSAEHLVSELRRAGHTDVTFRNFPGPRFHFRDAVGRDQLSTKAATEAFSWLSDVAPAIPAGVCPWRNARN